MTEYWVSQGNKWCDYCKIYIANNATSIRTHEFGTRHKDNVAKKLAAIRKTNAAKEKEKQLALKDLERIEAVAREARITRRKSDQSRSYHFHGTSKTSSYLQAKKSYERDLAAIRRSDAAAAEVPESADERQQKSPLLKTSASGELLSTNGLPHIQNEGSTNEWTYDEASGYHFNAATGYYYDPNSGLYYSGILGKWTTQEEALKASQGGQAGIAAELKIDLKREPSATSQVETKSKGQAPQIMRGKVKASAEPFSNVSSTPVSTLVKSQGPRRLGKGVPSSLEVGKRKRAENAGPVSDEEAAALAAREAARKRTQEREKSMLGLYQAY